MGGGDLITHKVLDAFVVVLFLERLRGLVAVDDLFLFDVVDGDAVVDALDELHRERLQLVRVEQGIQVEARLVPEARRLVELRGILLELQRALAVAGEWRCEDELLRRLRLNPPVELEAEEQDEDEDDERLAEEAQVDVDVVDRAADALEPLELHLAEAVVQEVQLHEQQQKDVLRALRRRCVDAEQRLRADDDEPEDQGELQPLDESCAGRQSLIAARRVAKQEPRAHAKD